MPGWRTYLRVAVVVVLVCLVLSASADRGSIPFNPRAEIFEPVQRAMIAWNGEEEVLLLSTDLRASEATKVLEVIPLPSEPKVTKGDVEVFQKAVDIINRHRPPKPAGTRGGAFGSDAKAEPPAAKITFHEKIGAHDISVAEVLNGDKFVEWVNDYLKAQGVENPEIPEPLKEVVNEYLDEGFKWFVFDVVELGPETKTNDAIQYRFKTDALYYPLKITRTEKGETTVELLILTPQLLNDFPGLPMSSVELAHQPIRLSRAELQELNADMAELLDAQDGQMLRIWRIHGVLSKFTKDLLAK
ncbi:MAG: DUF2330 domain-containing protein [Verrucomicrobia bacterium]|nr:DUF2330 domain-containing protein [Verrucomicrobiota bacterium]